MDAHRNRHALALTLGAGIAAGVIATALFTGGRPVGTSPARAAEAPPAGAATTIAPPVRAVRPSSPAAEAAALRGRIEALEQKAAADAERARTEPAGPPPLPTREEAQRHAAQEIERRRSEHAAERVDPAWAEGASRSLTTALQALGDAHAFQVADVDCRSISCVATIEWPSYAAATESFRQVAYHQAEPNCPRFISLPDPDEPAAPYRAQLFVDCTRVRQSPN